MNGPNHYAAAELELSKMHEESDGTWALARAQAATAHATLALAAATMDATRMNPEGWTTALEADN